MKTIILVLVCMVIGIGMGVLTHPLIGLYFAGFTFSAFYFTNVDKSSKRGD